MMTPHPDRASHPPFEDFSVLSSPHWVARLSFTGCSTVPSADTHALVVGGDSRNGWSMNSRARKRRAVPRWKLRCPAHELGNKPVTAPLERWTESWTRQRTQFPSLVTVWMVDCQLKRVNSFQSRTQHILLCPLHSISRRVTHQFPQLPTQWPFRQFLQPL